MNEFIKAFQEGQESAVATHLEKNASAADVAKILTALKDVGSDTLKKALPSLAKNTKETGRLAKALATMSDPRNALLIGGGASGLASLFPGIKDFSEAYYKGGASIPSALLEGLEGATPGLLGSAGAAVAASANPGMIGGSMGNRITHELAMQSRTPRGLIATMATVAGLPAAIYTFGKMKGREESSIF